jgi:hypothetical protein
LTLPISYAKMTNCEVKRQHNSNQAKTAKKEVFMDAGLIDELFKVFIVFFILVFSGYLRNIESLLDSIDDQLKLINKNNTEKK